MPRSTLNENIFPNANQRQRVGEGICVMLGRWKGYEVLVEAWKDSMLAGPFLRASQPKARASFRPR